MATATKSNGRYVADAAFAATRFEEETTPSRQVWEGRMLFVSIARITPEEAAYVLETCNTKNRGMKDRHSAYLAEAMAEGRWMLTGEAIIFDEDGVLQNGQNRLNACVTSNAPFVSVVVRGTDPEAFRFMDQTARRTPADVLGIEGESYCRNIAAAAGNLKRHEAGQLGMASSNMNPLAPYEVMDYLRRYPELRAAAAIGQRGFAILSPSIATTLYVLFNRIDAEQAARFFDDLHSGANLDPTDPVLLLRNRLIENRSDKAKLPGREVMALVVKTWNARRQGKTFKVLRWRGEGPTAEAFPTPV